MCLLATLLHCMSAPGGNVLACELAIEATALWALGQHDASAQTLQRLDVPNDPKVGGRNDSTQGYTCILAWKDSWLLQLQLTGACMPVCRFKSMSGWPPTMPILVSALISSVRSWQTGW